VKISVIFINVITFH